MIPLKRVLRKVIGVRVARSSSPIAIEMWCCPFASWLSTRLPNRPPNWPVLKIPEPLETEGWTCRQS